MTDTAEKHIVSPENLLVQLQEDGADVVSARLADADKGEWQVSSLGSSRRKGTVRPWVLENTDGIEQNVFVKKVMGYEAVNEVMVSEVLGKKTYKVLYPQNIDALDPNKPVNIVTETIKGYVPLESRATYRKDRFVVNEDILKGVAQLLFECREKGVILFDAKLRNFGIVTEASLLDPNDDGFRMVDFEHSTLTEKGVTPKREFLLSLRDFFWEVDVDRSFKSPLKQEEFKDFIRALYDENLSGSDIDLEEELIPAIFIGKPESQKS